MSELQIFNNPDFGDVRIMGDYENPEFCLPDVCKSLALPQVAKVVQRLDKEVLSRHPLETAGGIQQVYFVNEAGLYDVILDSRKPEAKRFRKWITSEVLPSIRKTGKYSVIPDDPRAALTPTYLRQIADRMETLENQVAELKPKAEYYDEVLNSDSTMLSTTVAIKLGTTINKFHRWLKQQGYANLSIGRIFQLKSEYSRKGYVIYKPVTCKDGQIREQMLWTENGFKWIREMWLGSKGQLPLF